MYQDLALELYQLFTIPENRKGTTNVLMDLITTYPDKYPVLSRTYNFENPKERGFFHSLLKITGIRLFRIQRTSEAYYHRYVVPPHYWFINPGIEQAVILESVLPHYQPEYRAELVDIIHNFFPDKTFFDLRTIREQIDSRWPYLERSIRSKGNQSLISSEIKKLGCTKWSSHPQNTVFQLPDDFWKVDSDVSV